MSKTIIIFGSILIAAAIFLVIAVLMQQGKSHNLSGTIAGGAETFFGKSKAQTMNKKLSVLTGIVAVVFVLIVVAFYVTQTTSDYDSLGAYFRGEKTTAAVDDTSDDTVDTSDVASDDTADTSADTEAPADTTAG